MSFQTFMAEWQTLNASVEALAAIGAELRLQYEGLDGDPRVRALLREVADQIKPGLFDDLNQNQQRTALALIQTSLRQALDLVEDPARAPGWRYEDPVILQSQGQASRMIVRNIEVIATQRPEFGAALKEPGVLLDVGTGVGWLAIEAASTWPALRVVGIDAWEPALRLARENLRQSSVHDRIDFRLQPIELLNDNAAFTLAWLPAPFIPKEMVTTALQRIYQALVPGGWLVVGLYAQPSSAIGKALANLRTVRGGGHPWTTEQLEEQLRASGFKAVETLSPTTPAVLVVIGRS
jgi:precorrin-6B methylase 2